MLNSTEQKIPEEKIDWQEKAQIEFPDRWPFRLAAIQTAKSIIENKRPDQTINWEIVYKACQYSSKKVFTEIYSSKQVERINQCYQQFIEGKPQALEKIYSFDNMGGLLPISQLLEILKNTRYQLIASDPCDHQAGIDGITAFETTLKDKHCQLTSLELWNNEIDKETVITLAAILKDKHRQLTSLHLGYNKSGDIGTMALTEVLKDEHCQLTTLNLWGNQINEKGAIALAEALKHEHCKLTSLNLGYNPKIGDAGIAALAAALQNEHCKLTSLNIELTQISQDGMIQLITALQNEHCKLLSLNLSDNRIDPKITIMLATALQNKHCKLKALNLSYNRIKQDGAIALAEALKTKHSKLALLNLKCSFIGHLGVFAIAPILKSHYVHHTLQVDLDELDMKYLSDFNKQWQKAQSLYTLFSHSDKNSQHRSILPPSLTVRCLFPYLYEIFKDELKQKTELKKVPVMKYVEESFEGKTIKKEKWITVEKEAPIDELVYPQSQIGTYFLEAHDRHFVDSRTLSYFMPM